MLRNRGQHCVQGKASGGRQQAAPAQGAAPRQPPYPKHCDRRLVAGHDDAGRVDDDQAWLCAAAWRRAQRQVTNCTTRTVLQRVAQSAAAAGQAQLQPPRRTVLALVDAAQGLHRAFGGVAAGAHQRHEALARALLHRLRGAGRTQQWWCQRAAGARAGRAWYVYPAGAGFVRCMQQLRLHGSAVAARTSM